MNEDLEFKKILNTYSKILNGNSKDYNILAAELGRYMKAYLENGYTKYSQHMKVMMNNIRDKRMTIILDELLEANLTGQKKDYEILNRMYYLLEQPETTYKELLSVFKSNIESIPQATDKLSDQYKIYVYDCILSRELILYQKFTPDSEKKFAEFLYDNEKLVGEGKQINWTEEVMTFLGRREKQEIGDLGNDSYIILKSVALSFKVFSYFNVMPSEKTEFLSLLKNGDENSFKEMIDRIKRILGSFIGKSRFEDHVFSHMVFANMKVYMLDEGKELSENSISNANPQTNSGEPSFKRSTETDKKLIKLRTSCVNKFLSIIFSVNRNSIVRSEVIRTIYSCENIDEIIKLIYAIDNNSLSAIHNLESKNIDRNNTKKYS